MKSTSRASSQIISQQPIIIQWLLETIWVTHVGYLTLIYSLFLPSDPCSFCSVILKTKVCFITVPLWGAAVFVQLSCCFISRHALLCLESIGTVNLRGKTGSLIALVLGGFSGLPSGFFLNFFSVRSKWILLAFCLGHVFRPHLFCLLSPLPSQGGFLFETGTGELSQKQIKS